MNLGFLLRPRSGIPVLMYHKLDPVKADYLTVTGAQFQAQMEWLDQQGYQTLRMEQFFEYLSGKLKRADLPSQPVMITFDDGYRSILDYAVPILEKYQFTATVFLTTGFVGKSKDDLDEPSIQAWVQAGHEVALHTHLHPSYRDGDLGEKMRDLDLNLEWFRERTIPYFKALAYPFGARPKEAHPLKVLKQTLQEKGIHGAFRIGNRVVEWSVLESGRLDRFEIPRIDIRGEDDLETFKTKVKKGRIRPFQ